MVPWSTIFETLFEGIEDKLLNIFGESVDHKSVISSLKQWGVTILFRCGRGVDRSTSRDLYSYTNTYSSLPNEWGVWRNDFSRPEGLLLYRHVGVLMIIHLVMSTKSVLRLKFKKRNKKRSFIPNIWREFPVFQSFIEFFKPHDTPLAFFMSKAHKVGNEDVFFFEVSNILLVA